MKAFSIRQAAEVYNVPKSTVHDRLTGKTEFGSHSEPPRHLTQEEEKQLVSFLFHCSSIGYPRSQKEIMSLVQNVLAEKGRNVTITNGW